MNTVLDRKNSVWCVIPTYNNSATIRNVVERTLNQRQLDGLIVVDDGSADCNVEDLLSGLSGVVLLKHEYNQGKGRAILTALRYLNDIDATNMITIDGDGQHFPEDIPSFFPLLAEDDCSIVIGARDFSGKNIPGSSKFGRNFSNFWIKLETGCKIEDAQSGFRAYPVKYISQLKFLCSHYNFEIEILVRASWAGIKLKNTPVRVWYPENPEERVSSFKPFLDNFRISLINIHLIGLRLLPLPRKKLVKIKDNTRTFSYFIKHPLLVMKELLLENASPGGLAAAAGVGAFLAIIPIPGFHTAAIIYASVRLHLNKVMAVNIQHIFMPPLTPLLCIEVGSYIRNGRWLTEITFDNILNQIGSLIVEWWIGALVLCLPLSIITAAVVYISSRLLKRKKYAL